MSCPHTCKNLKRALDKSTEATVSIVIGLKKKKAIFSDLKLCLYASDANIHKLKKIRSLYLK